MGAMLRLRRRVVLDRWFFATLTVTHPGEGKNHSGRQIAPTSDALPGWTKLWWQMSHSD
jgi:hypothetical protein